MNKNYKKMIIMVIISVFIVGAAAVFSNYLSYRRYISEQNLVIENLVELMVESGISEKDIITILNDKDLKNSDILNKYGIDLNKDAVNLKVPRIFQDQILITILLSGGLLFGVVYAVYRYEKKQSMTIRQIINELERINQKTYDLPWANDDKGEIAILQNELHKTAIILKEAADNSLQDKLRLKDALSDISHQLKTPLTGIMIAVDNILDNNDMDEQTRRQFLLHIRHQIDHINYLVISLLKLSRFDTNTITFDKKAVPVDKLINDAVYEVALLADLKGIEINIPHSDAVIECDPKWQKEALSNILKNAVEYSFEQGRVDILVAANKIYTLVAIKDKGKGISREDQKRIFERFYKAKNSHSEGVGIGLALAKAIIEKDGGRIEVSSTENQGTVFTIKYYHQDLAGLS